MPTHNTVNQPQTSANDAPSLPPKEAEAMEVTPVAEVGHKRGATTKAKKMIAEPVEVKKTPRTTKKAKSKK